MVTRDLMLILCALAACGCDLNPAAPPPSGVDLDAGDGGPSTCARAFVVTDSDYTSTNVSVVSPTGAVLSPSLVSSGSAPPGLTAALSGDVVSPLSRPPSGQVVLIDRGAGALTWLDPGSGSVLAQLSVATGFSSNPHDYLEVAPGKAYVTRFETNATPGKQPFDDGGDVLVIDPDAHTIKARIPMASPDDGMLEPRADRMLLVGSHAWVELERLDAGFTTGGDARIIGVDTATDTADFTVTLQGLQSCGGLAVSPSGNVVALVCSGALDGATPPAESGVVLLDATKSPPVELQRFMIAGSLNAGLSVSLAFTDEHHLVGVADGDPTASTNDFAYTLDLTSGTATKLADSGGAFVLGDVRCTPGCGDRCFLADAHANTLRVFQLSGGTLAEQAPVSVDPAVGLPPRGLGEI